MVPEEPEVRRLAAVTLGRMKAEETLPALRSMIEVEGLQGGAGYACAWAINQITGEEIPDIPPFIVTEDNWFLTPVNEPQ